MTTFAQHFPPSEFQQASDVTLTPAHLDYAAMLSHRLELFRHALGDGPLVISSYVRLGSVTDSGNPSQHRDGSAADVKRPAGLTWGKLVQTALALQHTGLTWGQFIIYPWEKAPGHFHISLPTGAKRQELIVKTGPAQYAPYSQQLAQSFPGELVTPADVTVASGAGAKSAPDKTLVAVAGGVAAAMALGALRGGQS